MLEFSRAIMWCVYIGYYIILMSMYLCTLRYTILIEVPLSISFHEISRCVQNREEI